MQLHDAAVDKADHHNGGGAGGLNHGGDAEAQEKALERVIGQLAQDLLQLAARLLFQSLAHDVHAEHIGSLYYPFTMGICALLAILVRYPKRYS